MNRLPALRWLAMGFVLYWHASDDRLAKARAELEARAASPSILPLTNYRMSRR